jgi:hypothetical protein
MEKNRIRALRRHILESRKHWVNRELRHLFGFRVGRSRAKYVRMLANTPVTCSCWMCGNPRKYRGERTQQELRVDAGKLEEKA